MGNGGNGGGGGLSGGKIVQTGTFLAEQTHSSPASYTLVSVGAASDKRKTAVTAQRGDRLRKSRAEKGGTHCTKLSALDKIDSLLLPNEEAPVPSKAGSVPASPKASPSSPKAKGVAKKAVPGKVAAAQKLSRMMAELAGPDDPAADINPDDLSPGGLFADADMETLSMLPPLEPVAPDSPSPRKGSPRKKAAGQKLSLQGRGVAETPNPDSSPGDGPDSPSSGSPKQRRTRLSSSAPQSPSGNGAVDKEVFGRLYITQKPWVADRTDCQLLQYLAWRGGSPEIASPPRASSAFDSFSSPRSQKRPYRNHRELFDDCLHREASPSPPPRDDSRRGASSEMDGRASKASSRGWSESRSVSRLDSRCSYGSPQRPTKASHEHNSKLFDQIEEIPIIPRDPVGSYLEAEGIIVESTPRPREPERSPSKEQSGASGGALSSKVKDALANRKLVQVWQ